MHLKVKILSIFRDKNDAVHAIIGENLSLLFMVLLPFKIWINIILTYFICLVIEIVNEYFIDKKPDNHDISLTMLFVSIGIVIGYLFSVL